MTSKRFGIEVPKGRDQFEYVNADIATIHKSGALVFTAVSTSPYSDDKHVISYASHAWITYFEENEA